MTQTGDRWKMVGLMFGLGGIVAGAAAAGGRPGVSLLAFMLIGGLGVAVAFSGWEWAVIQSEKADERQRSINDEATHFAYYAVLAVILIGFLFELAHGEGGPFSLLGAVGGGSHLLAIAYLKRRR